MRKISVFMTILAMFVLLVSCASSQPVYDMNGKGVFKAGVILQDPDTWSKIRPMRLFFKKIEDPKDLTKGKIISSKIKDDNSISLNVEPGVYSVIAVETKENIDNVFVFFDEETINYLKREIKAGELTELKDVYVVENSANLLGNVSDLQVFHREVIGGQYNGMMYKYKVAYLDKSLNKVEKSEKQKKIEKQVIEEQTIEEVK